MLFINSRKKVGQEWPAPFSIWVLRGCGCRRSTQLALAVISAYVFAPFEAKTPSKNRNFVFVVF
jgi:hypothetical protein